MYRTVSRTAVSCAAASLVWKGGGRLHDYRRSPPQRRVKIYNYTKDLMCRAFGKKEEPTYERYEAFLKSRCFPKSRNKMKLILEELGLPFYDPLMIIEKTEGRMADVKISVSVCVIFALRPG